MRVVFLGTPAFAVPSLQSLIDHSHEVCGVFTQPDRPSGRGQKLQPSPIKALAQKHGIAVFQPEKIRAEENRDIVESLKPDVIVAAAYGQIIPGWLLRCSRLFPVNIHASLLPKYRGAAPIPWAILNGDAISGVTLMVIEEALDAGAILLQEEVEIPLEMTAGELSTRLSEVGARLLIRALPELEQNALKPLLQDDSQVTWAPRIGKDRAPILWEKPALEIHNQIRAMNPWPAASATFRGEKLSIWRSTPVSEAAIADAHPGAFLGVSGAGIRVQCGARTVLEILEVQRPAKGRVSGRDFASGARLRAGELIFQ